MCKHTTGPWCVVAYQAPMRQAIETSDFSRHIATVEGKGPQVAADARLLAAAPEIYNALLAVLKTLDDFAAEVNWAASVLSADTIRQMNEVPKQTYALLARIDGMTAATT